MVSTRLSHGRLISTAQIYLETVPTPEYQKPKARSIGAYVVHLTRRLRHARATRILIAEQQECGLKGDGNGLDEFAREISESPYVSIPPYEPTPNRLIDTLNHLAIGRGDFCTARRIYDTVAGSPELQGTLDRELDQILSQVHHN